MDKRIKIGMLVQDTSRNKIGTFQNWQTVGRSTIKLARCMDHDRRFFYVKPENLMQKYVKHA